ncbi:hypothetical protein SLW70_11495 [Flavobacterium sp. NG2]|uniref:hypothetical protein n=1 Tax=Flavobacterium sp. NG2 TaxID=3097547 RepID=UPI002A82F757|nr:hypothetical protein [Flavobacterium sp. NG2]WPR70556.1 hypothetical protein SLW70_11495 [Flavobacterium sp. NG2]
MIINYEEQSDVTLFLLTHQYNNILQEISPAVTEFQKVTKILNEKIPALKYHLVVLEDLLSGEAKESFDCINEVMYNTQTITLQSITNISQVINEEFEKLNKITEILKARDYNK